MEDKIERLMEWGRQYGARIDSLQITSHSEVDLKQQSRSVISTRPIGPTEEICYIPATLILTESIAEASIVGKCVRSYLNEHLDECEMINDSEKHPHAASLLVLAAYMIHEQFETDGKSHWYPYLDSLPLEFSLPLCWKPRRRLDALLGGTRLHYLITERIQWIRAGLDVLKKSCLHLFPKGSLTDANLCWAASAVWSRAFSTEKPLQSQTQEWIGTSESCLYPILDMINHKRGVKIEWRHHRSDAGGVSFVAFDAVQESQELFNNYGSKGNENLLSNYGFVLEDNPEDYYKVFLNINPADPLFADKKQSISNWKCSLVHLLFDEPYLPAGLMASTRILVANQRELQIRKDPRIEQLSLRNDILAFCTLSLLLTMKLNELVESTPDYAADAKLFPSGDDERSLARIYREGQERILRNAIQQCRLMCVDQQGDRPSCKFASTVIYSANPKLDEAIVAFLRECNCVTMSEESLFDDDSVLSLIIMYERNKHESSEWYAGLTKLHNQVAQSPAEEDIRLHFESSVLPILQSLNSSLVTELINADEFVVAATMVEFASVEIFAGWIYGSDSTDIIDAVILG